MTPTPSPLPVKLITDGFDWLSMAPAGLTALVAVAAILVNLKLSRDARKAAKAERAEDKAEAQAQRVAAEERASREREQARKDAQEEREHAAEEARKEREQAAQDAKEDRARQAELADLNDRMTDLKNHSRDFLKLFAMEIEDTDSATRMLSYVLMETSSIVVSDDYYASCTSIISELKEAVRLSLMYSIDPSKENYTETESWNITYKNLLEAFMNARAEEVAHILNRRQEVSGYSLFK